MRVAELRVASFLCCRCGHHTQKKAALIRYEAPFCSDDCAERAGDFATECGHENIPDYPNDLNACAELLRTVIAEGWDVEIRNNKHSEPWTCLFWKDGRCQLGNGKELAIAICRAFIATMEGKQP